MHHLMTAFNFSMSSECIATSSLRNVISKAASRNILGREITARCFCAWMITKKGGYFSEASRKENFWPRESERVRSYSLTSKNSISQRWLPK